MEVGCVSCQKQFSISREDLAFYHRVSPTFGGTPCEIPPPTHCPDCRQQRRLALANERHFYSGTCELCSKNVLTEHPPHSKKTVYCRECWHSDRWDSCAYGRSVDLNHPIFEQIKALWAAVPAQNLLIEGTNVNSEYIHYAGFAKNCYLLMHADYCEDCYYGYGFKKNVSCVDGFYNLSCELCYDCVDVHKSYGLRGSQDCLNCSSSAFLRDCIGCKSCFLCVGLREKEYCFENQQLTKEAYLAKLSEFDLGSYATYQACKSRRKQLETPHGFKEFHGQNVENCSGDYISNCKDTFDSFDCEDVEYSRFLYQVVTGAKHNYDIYQYGLNLSESYECAIAGNNCYHVLFSHNAHVNCSDLLYCWFIQSSKNCFGCVSAHHKEYCILNKQYSRNEYEALVPKIIERMRADKEWGELFPVSFSPFGYNKTNAPLYYPMEKEEVLARGWKWDDSTEPRGGGANGIAGTDLPDNIDDSTDDILSTAIQCEKSGKLFRVTPQELRFYRSERLPLPRRSPDQRHLDRFAERNTRTIWPRDCSKCGMEIDTTYSPQQPELVYCEECYLAALY